MLILKKNVCNYLFNSNISSELQVIRSEGFQLLIKNDREHVRRVQLYWI